MLEKLCGVVKPSSIRVAHSILFENSNQKFLDRFAKCGGRFLFIFVHGSRIAVLSKPSGSYRLVLTAEMPRSTREGSLEMSGDEGSDRRVAQACRASLSAKRLPATFPSFPHAVTVCLRVVNLHDLQPSSHPL